MFLLNGKRIDITQDLTIGEDLAAITYPAGTLEDAAIRAELGIVEAACEPRPDDRFYWVGELREDGTYPCEPKDLGEVQARMVAQVRATAGALLAPSDWQIIRKIERGIEVDENVAAYRAAVIAAADANEAAILSKRKIETLAELVLSWPQVL